RYRPGPRATPQVALTPDEFWLYCRKNRSEFNAQSLPVAVEAFLPEVEKRIKSGKLKVSEKELKALFNKYKDREKDPENPKPGFMIPQKIEVEWIAADLDSPYYKGLADFVLAATKARLPILWEERLFAGYETIPPKHVFDPKNRDFRAKPFKEGDPLPKWT